MHREPLTDNQRAVYAYCQYQLEDAGSFPTMRAIQKAFELASVNSAFQYVDALRKKGYLKKQGDSYTFTDERLFMGPLRREELRQQVDAVLHRLHLALCEAGHSDDAARAVVSEHRTAFDNWAGGLTTQEVEAG